MTKKPHQQHSTVTNTVTTCLHPEILTILFENRRYLKAVFLELHGLYNLSHFGITIIDRLGRTLAFSTTPTIEYNLVNQDLWQQDCSFTAPTCFDDHLVWWDENENQAIKKIKLLNNKFSLGMTMAKENQGLIYLYSFATQHKTINLKEYYRTHREGIMKIGDYFFRSIQNLYASYATGFELHKTEGCILTTKNFDKPTLKLIVNNCNL